MYRATLNGNTFLDTSLDDDRFTLTTANVQFVKGNAGSFVFNVPPVNAWHDYFTTQKGYVDLYRDNELLFFGRIYSINVLTDNSLDVVCEGMLTVLSDTIFDPITHEGTLHELINLLIDSHNLQVEASKQITVGNLYVSDAACYRAYENYESTWSRLCDLADSYGGFFVLRRTNNVNYLDYYAGCTTGSSQTIDLGENLLYVSKYQDTSEICTVLTPLGAADENNVRLTIESVNQGSKELEADTSYINQYGYIHKTQIWDDVNVASILMAKGIQYLQACLEPQYKIDVTAVDLADAGYNIDHFAVGQKLKVTSTPHGIDNVWFDVNSQTLNLFRPQDNKLTLGTQFVSFVKNQKLNTAYLKSAMERIAATYTPRSALDDAINTATALITGNSGGHIVLHDADNDGEPDELLVLDTDSIQTAVKVWRFNNSGLGFSANGYDGTYALAMTMNGGIVADRITTGTLNADLLKAGIIRGQNGNSYWDLTTGVLHIEGSGDIDKSKVFIYEPVPPYYVGDLWCTQRSETSGTAGYAIAGYAVVGDESSGEGGKVMACIYSRTSGDFNPDDWTLITNYIDDSDLQVLEQRVSSAELNIAANSAEIQLKANTSVLDSYDNRLSEAEAEIALNSSEIQLKVSESDVTGNYLVSKINLNATTATIAANKIDLQGAVTFSTFDATTAGSVVIGSTSRNQYYLSTSSDEPTGGSWSNSVRWSSGKYIFTRIATTKTYADNTTATSYSDAVYDYNLTVALSTANSASNTANTAVASTVSCYYRSTVYDVPSISASTSIGTDGNTDNAWEYVLPRPKNGCYFYTCERYVLKDGTVSFSTVRHMTNLSYTSLWCSANNATYIDGASIYTGSVTANQIAANAITANKIASGAVTADKISVTDLYALGATIGGFTIDSTSLYTGTAVTSNASGAVALSKADFTRTLYSSYNTSGTAVSSSVSGLRFAIGSRFGVNSYGDVYCRSANIGLINCCNQTLGWNGLREDFTAGGYTYSAYFGSVSSGAYAIIARQQSGSTVQEWKLSRTGRVDANTDYYTTGTISADSFAHASDRRIKTDINELHDSKRIVMGLTPVSFRYINSNNLHHGFIAQDVEQLVTDDWQIVKEIEHTEVGGAVSSWKHLSYDELIADMVAVLQQHEAEIQRIKEN